MPSVSGPQKRLMAAVAHGWHKPGGGGPSVAVAKEFNQADKGHTMGYAKGGAPQDANYAEGGAVLGRRRDFLKEPVLFRSPTGKSGQTDYSETPAGKGGFGKTKSLKAVKPRS